MYAHKNTWGKMWILAPIVIVLGIVFGLEWVYYEQFVCYYWKYYPTFVVCISILFYIDSALILVNLFVCTVVDPGEVSRTWVTPS